MTDPTGAVHRVAAFLAMLPPCPYGCASPYPTPTFNTNEPIEQQVEALVGYYHQAAPHMLEDHLGNEHLGVTKRTEAAAPDPQDVIQVSRTDLGRLLAVATLYLDSFGPDEKFSAADLMMLQDIEETVERHGRRC